MRIPFLLAGLLFGGAVAGAEEGFVPPATNEILKTLNPRHPRLFLTAADLPALRRAATNDPVRAKWVADLRRAADRILRESPSKYEIPDGKRLLATSRRVLDRTEVLGLLYLLEGSPRHRDRLWAELSAAAAFKDWNPRHFLDTAEMTRAFALGYDWLFDAWTAEQRQTLKQAMVEKGFGPALSLYRSGGGFTRARHNWNQVCNGGLGLGALALADVEPAAAAEILRGAIASIPLAMTEYAPDGGWPEGPGYWCYATRYNAGFLAGLASALGTDFGLSRIPGLSEAGWFPIHAVGPLGQSFNYADAHAGDMDEPAIFWLGRRFARPEFNAFALAHVDAAPMNLLWYDGRTTPNPDPPLHAYFRHAEVVLLRSAWRDRNAFFVGFKAGDNKANHSHLDLGTFVFDALGRRWACDLAGDDYNLPGYFGKARWDYYRLRAEGHNTLVINPDAQPDQDPQAATRIADFRVDAAAARATADLTPAYAGRARKVERTVALAGGRAVVIHDRIECDAPAAVAWFMHTPARVEVAKDGRAAVLSQGGEVMEARLRAPEGARFTVRDAAPLPTSPHPAGQGSNRRVSKLCILLRDVAATDITVTLAPPAR